MKYLKDDMYKYTYEVQKNKMEKVVIFFLTLFLPHKLMVQNVRKNFYFKT